MLASWPLDIVRIGVLVIGANDGDLRTLLCVAPEPTGPTGPTHAHVCTGTEWAHPAPHLRRDWLGGPTPPTSAPGLAGWAHHAQRLHRD